MMLESTSSSTRLEPTICPTSLKASICSSRRASSRPPVLQLPYEVHVLHDHRRLRGEGLDQRHLAVIERVDLGADHRQGTNDLTREQHRSRHRGPDAARLLHVGSIELGVGEHVGHLVDPSLQRRPTDNGAAAHLERELRHVADELRGQSHGRRQPQFRSLDEVDDRNLGPAEAPGGLDDGVEHGVGIRGRPAQRGEDLVGGPELVRGVGVVTQEPAMVFRTRRRHADLPPPGSLSTPGIRDSSWRTSPDRRNAFVAGRLWQAGKVDPWTLGLIVLLALGLGAILLRRAARPGPQPPGQGRDAGPTRPAHSAVQPGQRLPQYLSELQARRAPDRRTARPTSRAPNERT